MNLALHTDLIQYLNNQLRLVDKHMKRGIISI